MPLIKLKINFILFEVLGGGSLMPLIKLKINFILFEFLGPNSFQAPKGPAVYKSHRLDHAQ